MSSDANNETADAPTTPLPVSDATQDNSPVEVAAPASPLPSVIVDPSLQNAEAATAMASVIIDPSLSDAINTQEAPAHEHQSEDESWSVGAFSEHEAERFADTLRPSWDVGPIDSEGAWASSNAPGLAHSSPAASGRVLAPSAESDGLPPVVIARGLDRRMVFALVGGLVLIALALWSMLDSEPEVPRSWNQGGSTTAAPPNAPVNAAPTPTNSTANATPPVAPIPAPEPPTAAPTPETVTPTPVPPATATPAPVAATTPQAETAPTPSATPTANAVAKSVHLRISTTPANAELKLDGDTVPNPFDAWVARGGSHAISASAEGYSTREWSVSFDQDQTLSFALKREAAKRPAPRRVRRTQRRDTSNPRPRGAGFVTDNPY